MKKAKTTTVAKPAKPAKLAQPVAQRLQHQITSLQHQVTSLKHRTSGTAKHKAKATTKHSRTRKWSPDADVACCSARAVAEAVRLASGRVLSDADVLALYWATASSPDDGQSVWEALRAAEACWQIFGQRYEAAGTPHGSVPCAALDDPATGFDHEFAVVHPIIVGLDLPWGEPHAVVVDIDGTWWSWGEPHTPDDFPGAVIEEAWAVTCR